jgi:mevalonate kinase
VNSSTQTTQTTACGKVILVGEHAVLYGAHAVAIPLHNYQLKVQVTPIIKKITYPSKLDLLIKKSFKILETKEIPLTIKITSQLESGSGLGSSAALCIATLKSILKIKQQTISTEHLAYLANKLEKNFHYNPSGIDTTVISQGSPILFAKESPWKKITISKKTPWPFLLINSQKKTPTWKMIEIAKPYFKSSFGKKAVETINELSLQTVEALENYDPQTVAKCLNSCAKILDKSKIVTSPLRDIIAESKKLGALAAKSTGGGGGGFVLALLDPQHFKKQIKKFEDTFGKKNLKLVVI